MDWVKWLKEKDKKPKKPSKHINWNKFKIEIAEYEKVPMVDEKYMEIEPTYCTYFGCGKILTRTEKLCGNKCLKHQVYIRQIF